MKRLFTSPSRRPSRRPAAAATTSTATAAPAAAQQAYAWWVVTKGAARKQVLVLPTIANAHIATALCFVDIICTILVDIIV